MTYRQSNNAATAVPQQSKPMRSQHRQKSMNYRTSIVPYGKLQTCTANIDSSTGWLAADAAQIRTPELMSHDSTWTTGTVMLKNKNSKTKHDVQ